MKPLNISFKLISKTKSIFLFFILLVLTTLFCCEEEEPKFPYYQLTADQIEWLNINGYWIYEDINNNVDTVYVESEINRNIRERWGHDNVYGYNYDEINLKVGVCPIIYSDTGFILTITGYTYPYIGSTINIDGEFTFGELSDGDTSVLVFESNFYSLTYDLVKSIGISKYQYNGLDSTNTVNLIGYKLD